jgi:RNase P/RNase MRP subunit p30
MIDIVRPRNNEAKFVNQAIRLGCKGLVFLYDQKNKNNVNNALKLKAKEKRIKIFVGFMGTKQKNMPGVDLFFATKSDRKFLKGTVDAIYDIEFNIQDTMKQRQGGLNQVLCRLMKDNDVSYIISFSSLLNSDKRADLIGKIMQNVLLCQKYKTRMGIATFASDPDEMRNPKDIEAFLRLAGVKDTKKAMNQVGGLAVERTNKKVLIPGVEQI